MVVYTLLTDSSFFSSFKCLCWVFCNSWKNFTWNQFQTDSMSRCSRICSVKYNFNMLYLFLPSFNISFQTSSLYFFKNCVIPSEQQIRKGSKVIKISLRRYSRVWNQMYSLAQKQVKNVLHIDIHMCTYFSFLLSRELENVFLYQQNFRKIFEVANMFIMC